MKGLLERLQRGTIVCDSCRRRFNPQLIDKRDPDSEGGVLRMFQCPRCGAEYMVARITARGMSLMQEIQDVVVSAPGARRTIQKLQRQLKSEVKRA